MNVRMKLGRCAVGVVTAVTLFLALGGATTAEARPAKAAPIPMGQVWQWADEDTFALYLEIPEAYDYGVNCHRTARTRATCDATLYGRFLDGTPFECSWQEYFWTKVRPRNYVYYDFSDPVCAATGPPYLKGKAGPSELENQLADKLDSGSVARP